MRLSVNIKRENGPFVGRIEERDQVWSALQTSVNGELRCILVKGTTGIGKSALMGWLARRAHVLGVALPLMMSHEEGFSEYDGVPGMLRREWRAIGLSGTVLLEHVRAHIENTPLIADEATLVNSIETHRVSSHDESHKIARFAAVARWVEMLCKERPRILIVDDFQWDTETGVPYGI